MNKWTKLAACTALAGSIGLPVELAFAQVDELVVTARKREESLQDVPLSVSAFSSQQLEQKNLFGIEEIAQFVPGFEMDRSFQRGFERPVIRGKSVILTSGEPGTSFFINGAFFDGTLSSIDLDEAERVEIIKGPQSALYGRATYAGAVNVITKLPGNEWTGKISGTAAQKDEFTISGGISGPLVQDILSVGVYARHYEFGGMWRSETDGRRLGEEESDSIAGTIVFTPNEDWQITLRGVYDDRDDGAVPTNLHPFRLNNVFLRTPDFTIDSTIDQKRFPGFEYFDGELKQQAFQSNNTIASLLGEPGESEEHWGVQFNVEWDITDAFKFLSFTSFDEFDSQFILGAHEAGGGVFAGGPCSPSFFFCFVPPATPTDLSFQIAGGGISNFIVNDDVSTNSFSQDIRIEYDDGGAWRAALGGYHYNRNTTGVNLGFPGLDLAASLTPDQSAAILGSMRRYSQIIAREICTDAYSGICDPTTGSPILGGSVPAAFFNLNDPAAVVAALGNDLGSQSIDKTTNWAVYGRVEWDITSQWTVGFEGRYARETKETIFYDFSPEASPPFSPIPTLRQAFPFDKKGFEEAKFNSFTPRFTIDWDVTDDNLIYFVAARGTKPGGFNTGEVAVDQGLTSFDEEKIWSYELGTKNTMFNGQLQLNVAGYYEKIKGYQLTTVIFSPNVGVAGSTGTAIDNKGEVRIFGGEIGINFAPNAIEGLNMNLGYAYNNAEFTGGSTDATSGQLLDVADDGVRNCSTGTQNGDPAVFVSGLCQNAVEGSIDGNWTPISARHQLTGAIFYSRPMFNTGWDWFAGVDASHTSKKFVQVQNLAVIPPATLVNASIGIENDNFRLSLWGKNLFDEDDVVNGTRFIEADKSFRRAFLTFPRRNEQFGITATARF